MLLEHTVWIWTWMTGKLLAGVTSKVPRASKAIITERFRYATCQQAQPGQEHWLEPPHSRLSNRFTRCIDVIPVSVYFGQYGPSYMQRTLQ
ncbi:hypothetical protein CGRA01v4_03345 [Colletotrichum graminicola]|nr:hypothetical protein CGRA01v4_03345 [Colletotrichum graminicola]